MGKLFLGKLLAQYGQYGAGDWRFVLAFDFLQAILLATMIIFGAKLSGQILRKTSREKFFNEKKMSNKFWLLIWWGLVVGLTPLIYYLARNNIFHFEVFMPGILVLLGLSAGGLIWLKIESLKELKKNN